MEGIQWSWVGPSGFSSTDQNPFGAMPGLYKVTATSPVTGCSATGETVVSQNQPVIDVTATGGTLSCKNQTVQLKAFSQKNGLIYVWSDPNGFSSNQQSPTVSYPGKFQVIATDPSSGCTATSTTEVFENIDTPAVWATNEEITCLAPRTNLLATSDLPNARFWWTGPNGFSLKKNPVTVAQPGQYTVRAFNPDNGCASAAISIEVTLN